MRHFIYQTTIQWQYIFLQYFDTNGKINNVNVVIRNTEKEIFSGTYFTLMFETSLNDHLNYSLSRYNN